MHDNPRTSIAQNSLPISTCRILSHVETGQNHHNLSKTPIIELSINVEHDDDFTTRNQQDTSFRRQSIPNFKSKTISTRALNIHKSPMAQVTAIYGAKNPARAFSLFCSMARIKVG